jgi:diguanylate cyclase (GGDEF)-like protein
MSRTAGAHAKTADRLRVLYVEDDPDDVGLLRRALRDARSAIELLDAPTLREALEILEQQTVAAVLLDIGLPDASGLEGLAHVRARHERLPVVVVAGHDDPLLEQDALRAGAQDYILKEKLDSYHLRRAIRHAIERQENLEALAERDLRYALLAEASGDGLWDIDLATGEAHFSARLRTSLDWPAQDARRLEDWFASIHPTDVSEVRETIEACLDGPRDQFELECRLVPRPEEEQRWISVRGCVRRDSGGWPIFLCCAQRDVTERKHDEERVRRNAYHDTVTGLPNRALLIDRIGRSIHRSSRHPEQRFAVLFLDMDDFKLVNDSLGHLAGDQVLVEVAQRLTSCVRPEDTVARLGGDEFVVLLENTTGAGGAIRVAERIRAALAEPISIGNHEVYARASIGIALGDGDGRGPEDLLREADTALYRAKAAGGGYEVFDRSMHAHAVLQLQLEADLIRAVERGEFVPHFQPIVQLETRRLTGFEALVRWNHPTRGLLTPADFLPTASSLRLLAHIDRIVLRQACEWLVELERRDPTASALGISVNRSRESLFLADATDEIREVLSTTNLPPDRLRLEISENALLTDDADMHARLAALRERGVEWHLDDFGTGYSSLSMLARFPIQAVKIDRSFVHRMDADGRAAMIVRGIAGLARDLGIGVIAEGIETERQCDRLVAMGCAEGQGYLIAKPLAPEDAAALVASRPNGRR